MVHLPNIRKKIKKRKTLLKSIKDNFGKRELKDFFRSNAELEKIAKAAKTSTKGLTGWKKIRAQVENNFQPFNYKGSVIDRNFSKQELQAIKNQLKTGKISEATARKRLIKRLKSNAWEP